MGHIDHGKSTLLDYIRKTNIVDQEAGGITQHISAYEVIHRDEKNEEKKITFLDTPGHAAFSKMRERGANIADIAILIVSAEDGVKPQTIEAWKTISENNVPCIVAINKIDKEGANVEKTKTELAENEIYLENYGGTIPFVEISAKKGTGIDNLLSLILILAEMENFTGIVNENASGLVIETNLDPKRGISATLIIKNGTLKKGMTLVVEDSFCCNRIMENFLGKSISEATFSSPIKLVGFNKVPSIGAEFKSFLNKKEADLSYNFKDKARFRVNVFFQRGTVSCALRLVNSKIPTLEELNLPDVLNDFTKATQGFVVVTGPSSHGKSTTLASLIDSINHSRAVHIITIEDPIEYIFKDDRAVIEQREIDHDTLSFATALRSTFRQDPDIIMVGEMRDPETIAAAITAAETGHLVFATLHTNSASQTIHRIVDSFPPEQQQQIRAQLSGSLLGVVSQRLIPRIKGGLIPATEIMMANPAVANLIRENKIHELPLVIETSAEKGMISLNRSLANLVKQREISLEHALNYSLSPTELKMLTR